MQLEEHVKELGLNLNTISRTREGVGFKHKCN